MGLKRTVLCDPVMYVYTVYYIIQMRLKEALVLCGGSFQDVGIRIQEP